MAGDVGYMPFTIWSDYYWSEDIDVENADGSAFDLTDYYIEAQIRETRDKNSELIGTITITHDDDGGTMSLVMDNSSSSVTHEEGWTTLVFTPPGGNPTPWASGPVKFEKYPTVPA